MVVTKTVYTDQQALAHRCGGAGACVWTDQKNFCDMHLPAAANGDVIMSAYWHEKMHCIKGQARYEPH